MNRGVPEEFSVPRTVSSYMTGFDTWTPTTNALYMEVESEFKFSNLQTYFSGSTKYD